MFISESLDWLLQLPEFGSDDFRDVTVTLADFQSALKFVQPSALRQGYPTVPDVAWADTGAIDRVRETLDLNFLVIVNLKSFSNALF